MPEPADPAIQSGLVETLVKAGRELVAAGDELCALDGMVSVGRSLQAAGELMTAVKPDPEG